MHIHIHMHMHMHMHMYMHVYVYSQAIHKLGYVFRIFSDFFAMIYLHKKISL